MADEASTSQVTGGSSDSTIEIRVKTLDSQQHTFRVDKSMPLPVLKEKLVTATGVPAERQRLIFGGKVLKDEHLLSDYNLEDGDTLHLVARQPQEQPSPGTSSVGNDSTADAPRNMSGQVPHGVVLGTVNIGDNSQSMINDVGRFVGQVLSTLVVGNSASGGEFLGTVANATRAANDTSSESNQVPSNAETEGSQSASDRNLSGNTAPPRFTIHNNPLQSLHQLPPFTSMPPFTSTGPRTWHLAIPDSLATLSDFISRLELALQSGASEPVPPIHVGDPLRPEFPSSNVREPPTPQMLRAAMERAQQLLRNDAAAALSRVATRLEREGTSPDQVVRDQIQAEAMHVGGAMQHLGAMLLELGRIIMTLRMGQSPAESLVNNGPPVYISPTGPNPVMIQPFPLQMNPVLGASFPPLVSGVAGPFAAGDPSRIINVHIHPGNRGVSSAATRPGSSGAVSGERPNMEATSGSGNGSGDSAPVQGLPSRTAAATIPAHPSAGTASHVLSFVYPVHVRSQLVAPIHSASAQGSHPALVSGTQLNAPTNISQPGSGSNTIPTSLAHITAQVAHALLAAAQGLSSSSHSMQHAQGTRPSTGSQTQPDTGSTLAQTSSEYSAPVAERNAELYPATSDNAQGQSSSSSVQCADISFAGEETQQVPPGAGSEDVNGQAVCVLDAEDSGKSAANNPQVPDDSVRHEEPQLQLGLPFSDNVDSRASSHTQEGSSVTSSVQGSSLCQPSDAFLNKSATKTPENNSEAFEAICASRSSQGSESDRSVPLGLGLGGLQPKRRGKTEKPIGKDRVTVEAPSTNQDQQSFARGQQCLHALASQSSDMNRVHTNASSSPPPSVIGQTSDAIPLGTHHGSTQGAAEMMSHLLQSPAINNLLTGVAAQLGQSQDTGAMLSGFDRGQGGMDFSRMIQQMMPAVLQTLGGGESRSESIPGLEHENQSQHNDGIGAMLSGFGRGQGGMDLSSMFQQMLPVVSQAFGRGQTLPVPITGLGHENQPQCSDDRTGRDDMVHGSNSQIGLQQAAERIEHQDSLGDVFHAVLENAGDLYGEGNYPDDLVRELANSSELANEFAMMSVGDLRRRMHPDSVPED